MPVPSRPVSVLDEVGDREAPIGSRPWAVWLLGQARLRRSQLDDDVDLLKNLIVQIRDHRAWEPLGLPAFEALCRDKLNLTTEQVQAVLTARRGQLVGAVLGGHGGARPGAGRPKLQQQELPEGVQQTEQQTQEGVCCTPEEGENNQPVDNRLIYGSTNAPYLRARLERDRPDIAERLDRGEFRSVRAAAIEAGIVKVPDPVEVLLRGWRKLSDEQKAEFLLRAGIVDQ